MAGLGAAVIFAGTKLRGGPLAVGLRTVSYSACDYQIGGGVIISGVFAYFGGEVISLICACLTGGGAIGGG